ncbi:MAG: hypothetical protein DMF76_07725 [Acidobacteria bacterium]|nr:MAG: hypothetical protein DMF76_07725 [Acidobacteriota bacterium]
MRLGTVTGSSLIKKVGFLGSQASQGTLRIEFYDTTLDFQKVPYQILRGLVTAKVPKGALNHPSTHIQGAVNTWQIRRKRK